MSPEQKQSDAELNRLVEIYKFQAQLTSDIDNLQTTTNRFYQLLLSGLVLIFITFLQYKSNIFPEESVDELFIQKIMILGGILGASLSWTWSLSIDSYLKLKAQKYEVLKELETKLEFQFFTYETELSNKLIYFKYPRFESLVPFLFFFISVALLTNGILKMPNKLYLLFLIHPIIIFLWLMFLRLFPLFSKKDTSRE